MAIDIEIKDGVGELIINAPPVNALDNAGWKEFAAKMTALGQNEDVNCVVIRAIGKGFQCGVDVKELAADGSLIVELNRGCYDSFAAVYDCPVPTISAVNGFCIGGGLGIAGASDFIIAADDSTYCLPEIDRGALGAATHLMRMVGVQKARRMLYTCETIDAQELFSLGGPARSCLPTSSRAVPARWRARSPARAARRSASASRLSMASSSSSPRLLPLRAGLHARALHDARFPGSPRRLRREAGSQVLDRNERHGPEVHR